MSKIRSIRSIGLATCTLLVAVMLFLWGRSTDVLDSVFYSTYRYDDVANIEVSTLTGAFSKSGSAGLWHFTQREPIPTWRRRLVDHWSWSEGSAGNRSWPTPNRFGFRFGGIDDVSVAGRPGLAFTAHGVMVPYWLLIALVAVPPARAVLRLRRTVARARRGQCVTCGYDLRGSPGRCPECGAVAARREPPHNPPMQRTATASSGAVE